MFLSTAGNSLSDTACCKRVPARTIYRTYRFLLIQSMHTISQCKFYPAPYPIHQTYVAYHRPMAQAHRQLSKRSSRQTMQFIRNERVAAAYPSIKASIMLARKVKSKFFVLVCNERQQSYSTDPQMVSLTRSGSFMSSSSPRQQPFTRKTSIDGNGGGMSDDSMHEKYFKSVENTPETRRRNTSSLSSNPKHSSDSSPQSPISPQTNVSLTIVTLNTHTHIIYRMHFPNFSLLKLLDHQY